MSHIKELNIIFRIMRYDMKETQFKKRNMLFILITALSFLLSIGPAADAANEYTNSAHGDSTYGVNRSGTIGFPTDYPAGFCAHCHEQHASIGGSEPNPTGGPSDYSLFYTNHTSQTDNFCYQCHTDSGSYQYGGLVNRNYSYRAGGWTDIANTTNDILEAFSSASSHNLDDISTEITGRWNYTSDSNPCNACHNPHAAQGDPVGAGSSAKSSTTRGWPVSRPSLHSTDNNSWGLWGDNAGEKMSDYTSGYQSPYRYDSTTIYEPDGSTTQDGSNLADFNTFCTDCHNTTYTAINSTALGRNLKAINWVTTGGESGGDKHGKNGATGGINISSPFSGASSGLYVLSCTDCHEPHGSPNVVLIRKEVNGGLLSGSVTTIAQPPSNNSNKELGYLCRQCHTDDYDYSPSAGTVNAWEYVHHCAPDHPYNQSSCSNCHGSGGGKKVCSGGGGGEGGGGGGGGITPINCNYCHYHGSSDSWAGGRATGKRTF